MKQDRRLGVHRALIVQIVLTICVKAGTMKENKDKCYEQENASGCLTESCGLL